MRDELKFWLEENRDNFRHASSSTPIGVQAEKKSEPRQTSWQQESKKQLNKLRWNVQNQIKKSPLEKFSRKQRILAISFVIIAIVVSAFVLHITPQKKPDPTAVAGTTAIGNQLPEEKPSFPILLPKGKDYKQVKVVRLSPDNVEPAYTFVDKLAGSDIQVTQQELPDKLKGNSKAFQDLVNSRKASQQITTLKGTLYTGTQGALTDQIGILATDSLLVFFRSTAILDSKTWRTYIGEMHFE